MTTEKTISIEQFNKEIVEFRKLMGDKRFWQAPVIVLRAVTALLLLCSSVEKIHYSQARQTYKTTINEFKTRAQYLNFSLSDAFI